MYAEFFGLKREPFSIAPDPHYLFLSERHREALAHLLYGVNGGGGFVLLTGEIGAGKTTVCRCFLEQIPKRCNVAYIFNPKLSAFELLQSICEEFGIPVKERPLSGESSSKDCMDALNEFLLRTHAVGQNNVLIIDEAQNLCAEVLEQLRLLTNLETTERKLLQIILIGQPELRDVLAQPALEQLAQRVIARYHLCALSREETGHYIRHRMAVAGFKGILPFERSARRHIHHLTKGVPRRINLLCDRALLGAYSEGKAQVDIAIVERAAKEVFETRAPSRSRQRWLRWGAYGALSLGALTTLTWAALKPPPKTSIAAASAPPAASAPSAPASVPMVEPASAATTLAPASTAPTASAPAPALLIPAVAASNSSLGYPMSDAELKAKLKESPQDEKTAWRELGALWRLSFSEAGDPCLEAQMQQAQCFKHSSAGLLTIKQLDRPGLLILRDDGGKPVSYGVLSHLDRNINPNSNVNANTARLLIGGNYYELPVNTLVKMWRGDFATFWRTPPGFDPKRPDIDPSNLFVDWLSTQLTRIQGEPLIQQNTPGRKAALRSSLSAFQLTQGLPPDGQPTPATLMQINRLIGIDEPRLLQNKVE
jgi:general secretion pathway protein A